MQIMKLKKSVVIGASVLLGFTLIMLNKSLLDDGSAPQYRNITIDDFQIKQYDLKQERVPGLAVPCRSEPRQSPLTKAVYYCGIPKVASTFTGGLVRHLPVCNKYTNFCSNGTEGDILGEKFSFMWAREPYGRIFSAYENKLFHPNQFWKKLGVPIIKTIRKDATDVSLKYGHDVTFAELVRHMINVTEDKADINNHLKPMYKFCDPCERHFDFVGRLESFTEDVTYVCNQFFKMGLLNTTEACHDVPSEKRMVGRVHKLFGVLNTYRESLSPQDRMDIMQRTWKSYQIRGLLSKSIPLPFKLENASTVGTKAFIRVLLDSMSAFTDKDLLKAQRKEALVQAYMTVPLEDMEKLKEFVKKDCLIFGYELRPAKLFQPRVGYSPDFDYFNGLM